MVIYTPQAARRRQLLILTVAAFLVGGVLGGIVGWFLAPTPADRVASVREQARQTTSQLRVMSLHAEEGAISLGASGDGGAKLALQRADTELTDMFAQAPWITADQRNALRAQLRELQRVAGTGAATKPFAADVNRLATDIDTTFGLTSTSP
ncbi:MAG: hypothetical protein ACRDRA_20480 [Pseudonocardiaceae bacterium]